MNATNVIYPNEKMSLRDGLHLAMPTEHMFLKPVPTRRIAEACGVELNYRPESNWLTCQCLLRLAERLKETLADLEPRDMIDLQGFVWLVARNAA